MTKTTKRFAGINLEDRSYENDKTYLRDCGGDSDAVVCKQN